MRSPFSGRSGRSRFSFKVDSWYMAHETHSEISKYDTTVKHDVITDRTSEHHDESQARTPLDFSPLKIAPLNVARWRDSVAQFLEPTETSRDGSTRKSTSTISTTESSCSYNSEGDDSRGPKTPTGSGDVYFGPLPNADVGLAAPPKMHATNVDPAQPKVRRAFSFEIVPEAPTRPAPLAPEFIDTRGELDCVAVENSYMLSHPVPDVTTPIFEATLKTLFDDFIFQTELSANVTPSSERTPPPILRINTKVGRPSKHSNSPEVPIIEVSPTGVKVGEMLSLGYKAYSESRAEQDRILLSFADRQASSSRYSNPDPTPRGSNMNYDEFRKGAIRYSQEPATFKRVSPRAPHPRILIPTNTSTSRPILPLAPRRASLAFNSQPIVEDQTPVKYVPYRPAKPIQPAYMPVELESSPTRTPSPRPTETDCLALATNRGLPLENGFFAMDEGLQIKMTRMVSTFSKMEWVIQDLSGSRKLKCLAQTNSLSRRKDFVDMENSMLFSLAKRIGSTRVAENPSGAELFSIQNASLSSIPHWTVKLPSGSNSSTQWIAKGDENLQTVLVWWGGFEVGRIKCESRAKKHTYIVTVAPEMNYAIMAALTTVFDDLRTDEGC